MNTSRTNLQNKSTLDKKMLALVALTLVSSVIGGWPFIVLATVFVYTQIIVKIPIISIGVIFSAVIGLLITIPIITSIIRSSKQLIKLSTRIGYFLLIGLSTFSTAGGVYNSTHNIIATIIAGFIVIVIVAFIFNDSEHNDFKIIPQKYTGPDSPISDKFLPNNVDINQLSTVLIISIAAIIALLINAFGSIFINNMDDTHELHSIISSGRLFATSQMQLLLYVGLPIIIITNIVSYFIAINNSKKESLEARDSLSLLLTNTQIQKLQLAISDILQYDYAIDSKIDYIKKGDMFSLVSYYLKIKSTLRESEIADTMDKLMLAYPNRFKKYNADEFNQVLDKFVKH